MYVYKEDRESVGQEYIDTMPDLVMYYEVWPSDEACKPPKAEEEVSYSNFKDTLKEQGIFYSEWPADGPCEYLMIFATQEDYDKLIKLHPVFDINNGAIDMMD